MDELILLVAGLIIGTIGTLVGAGGGFLLVPFLLFLYPDDPPSVVTSTSLAVVFINAVSGSIAYATHGRIDYRSGLVLAIATVPGSVIGALLTERIARGPFTILFCVILIGVAALLLLRPVARPRSAEAVAKGGWQRVLVDRSGATHVYSFSLWQAFLVCLGIGFFSSLLGIGGGIIQVPIFILVFHFPIYVATATSQFMLAIMSFAGTATHVAGGDFHDAAVRTALLAPGVIAGSQFGAWLSKRVRPVVITRLLAVTMILAAARLVMAQLT